MTAERTLFARVPDEPPDAVLHLMQAFSRDPRGEKIDVGVGVFRDGAGRSPVLTAVKQAEQLLFERQDTKAYVGPEGDLQFLDRLAALILRAPLDNTWASVQTPGGTGALRLALELMRASRPDGGVWLGAPSWPNHGQIIAAVGIRQERYGHEAPLSVGVAEALDRAGEGDGLLLHGCGHNPTGLDLSEDDWRLVARRANDKRLFVIMDLAYHGLARGLAEDLGGVCALMEGCDEFAIAYSCDKNFSLYRDRVGALFVRTRSDAIAKCVKSNLLSHGRTTWSMPPDHGAAIVRLILEDGELTRGWKDELNAMRARIEVLRGRLADAHPLFARLREERGMFSLLPVSAEGIAALREKHAVYMPASGRINVAGLADDQVERFVHACRAVLGA